MLFRCLMELIPAPHSCLTMSVAMGRNQTHKGRGGMEGKGGRGRDLCLSCCRAACVRVREGRGAGCVLYCSGVREEYYCYALRHNEAL